MKLQSQLVLCLARSRSGGCQCHSWRNLILHQTYRQCCHISTDCCHQARCTASLGMHFAQLRICCQYSAHESLPLHDSWSGHPLGCVSRMSVDNPAWKTYLYVNLPSSGMLTVYASCRACLHSGFPLPLKPSLIAGSWTPFMHVADTSPMYSYCLPLRKVKFPTSILQ